MQVLPSLKGVCKPPIQLAILVLNYSTAQVKTARVTAKTNYSTQANKTTRQDKDYNKIVIKVMQE
jgi:hypothetical protein